MTQTTKVTLSDICDAIYNLLLDVVSIIDANRALSYIREHDLVRLLHQTPEDEGRGTFKLLIAVDQKVMGRLGGTITKDFILEVDEGKWISLGSLAILESLSEHYSLRSAILDIVNSAFLCDEIIDDYKEPSPISGLKLEVSHKVVGKSLSLSVSISSTEANGPVICSEGLLDLAELKEALEFI